MYPEIVKRGRQTFAADVEAIYRFFWSHVGNREDAEDLTAQVLHLSHHLLQDAPGEGEISESIRGECRAVLADYLQRHFGGSARELMNDDFSANVQRSTADALAALPARHREVLELCLVRGYLPEEAAHKLGVSIQGLRELQRQALAGAARATHVHSS
jgi:DNA-directed RNA polymerase specialized sigma24 family protein